MPPYPSRSVPNHDSPPHLIPVPIVTHAQVCWILALRPRQFATICESLTGGALISSFPALIADAEVHARWQSSVALTRLLFSQPAARQQQPPLLRRCALRGSSPALTGAARGGTLPQQQRGAGDCCRHLRQQRGAAAAALLHCGSVVAGRPSNERCQGVARDTCPSGRIVLVPSEDLMNGAVVLPVLLLHPPAAAASSYHIMITTQQPLPAPGGVMRSSPLPSRTQSSACSLLQDFSDDESCGREGGGGGQRAAARGGGRPVVPAAGCVVPGTGCSAHVGCRADRELDGPSARARASLLLQRAGVRVLAACCFFCCFSFTCCVKIGWRRYVLTQIATHRGIAELRPPALLSLSARDRRFFS